MSILDARFEVVSGRETLLVAANLADGGGLLRDGPGFYGFVQQEYQKDNLVTVRI